MRKPKYLVYLFSAASHSLFVRLNFFDVAVKFISCKNIFTKRANEKKMRKTKVTSSLAQRLIVSLCD